MSEIDRIYEEREARRVELERQRQQRVDVAVDFITEFYEKDVKPSQTLAKQGVEASWSNNHLVFHRSAAGIHGDPFIITVGPDGEIDCAGRSLGRYSLEQKVQMRRELVAELLNFFDM